MPRARRLDGVVQVGLGAGVLMVLIPLVANAYFLNIAVSRMVWPATMLTALAGLGGLRQRRRVPWR